MECRINPLDGTDSAPRQGSPHNGYHSGEIQNLAKSHALYHGLGHRIIKVTKLLQFITTGLDLKTPRPTTLSANIFERQIGKHKISRSFGFPEVRELHTNTNRK